MKLTITSVKGGVGKTTVAVHLAAYLKTLAATLLVDGDPTRNATAWAKRGSTAYAGGAARKGKRAGPVPFPFPVEPLAMAAMLGGDYAHKVLDSGQRPEAEDLREAARGSDLLVIPAVPSALDTDGLGQTLRELARLQVSNYRVLLTKVSPDMAGAALELRAILRQAKAPCFKAEIPRLKAFEKAAAAGVTVDQVDDRQAARAWAAFVAVGKELKAGAR